MKCYDVKTLYTLHALREKFSQIYVNFSLFLSLESTFNQQPHLSEVGSKILIRIIRRRLAFYFRSRPHENIAKDEQRTKHKT